jgi:transcriptional accessory protein Tex/SPT6
LINKDNFMTANGNTKRRYENAMPVTHEGWWESVLAEERRNSTHASRLQHMPQKTYLAATKQQESTQNPWKRVATDFAEDHILPAKITGVLSYGAFARLQIGIEGLIHATEVPLAAGETPRDILTEGQQVQVRISHIGPAHQRMRSSLQTNS